MRWIAGPDSFALAIAPSGLPRMGRIARAGGGVLRAHWVEWTRVSGVGWPARLDLDDEAGTWSARCRIQRVRFAGADGGARTRVRVPEEAESLGWADVRRVFERGGVQP